MVKVAASRVSRVADIGKMGISSAQKCLIALNQVGQSLLILSTKGQQVPRAFRGRVIGNWFARWCFGQHNVGIGATHAKRTNTCDVPIPREAFRGHFDW